jgi:hypothetical protein
MMKYVVGSFVGAWLLGVAGAAGAQSLAYNSGQNVAPAYEGWEEDADGTKYFLFGYMNRNWEEELDLPVGPANSFSPGAPDQGQPTHFLPRRNIFVFRVKVPAGFTAKDELTWTLTSHGVTEHAHASLREDYKVDDVVRASETGALGAGTSSPETRANKKPVLTLSQKTFTAKVGVPLSLEVTVTDDGIPKPRSIPGLTGPATGRQGAAPAAAPAAGAAQSGSGQPSPAPAAGGRGGADRIAALVLGPPARVTVGKNLGLHVTWLVYRSPEMAKVSYEPRQIKAWQDTRAGANSPWAPIWIPPTLPPDGKVKAQVTFSKPGTYVLRAHADDGALTDDEDITVTVSP